MFEAPLRKTFEEATRDEPKHGWDEDGRFYNCSAGCVHNSFWASFIQTPEWDSWRKENARRLFEKEEMTVYDVDESAECGWMSVEHARAFLKFVRNLK